MHCDLAQFKSWSDAQMGICGLKELVRGGGREKGGKRGQGNKKKVNYLRWNITPGRIYCRPSKKMPYLRCSKLALARCSSMKIRREIIICLSFRSLSLGRTVVKLYLGSHWSGFLSFLIIKKNNSV